MDAKDIAPSLNRYGSKRRSSKTRRRSVGKRTAFRATGQVGDSSFTAAPPGMFTAAPPGITHPEVSMPLARNDLGDKDVRDAHFNVRNAAAHVSARTKDPWGGYSEVRQRFLPKQIARLA